MKDKPLLFFAAIAWQVSVLSVFADYIFNADFEDPPHVVNQQVVTGSAVNLPTGADPSVMIRTNMADFSTQVASLEPAGAMAFFYAPAATSGQVHLSWDLAILSVGTGGGLDTAAIAIQSSPSGIGNVFIDYEYDYDLEIAGVNVGSYALEVRDHYEFLFDLDADFYDVWVNGNLALNHQLLNSAFDIQNVLFSRENLQNPSYAVDNFRWEIIPEPSTVILLAMGGLVLGLNACRRRR